MTQRCGECGSDLRQSRSNANRGQTVKCRVCYRREWYLKNQSAVKEQSRQYYSATREKRIEVARKWREENLDQHRRNARRFKLKNKYGITPEQYEQMVKDQNGVCFLCGKKADGKRLSIDHCHKTNHVRKLLCQDCNLVLGFIERDLDWLRRALEYLNLNDAVASPTR